MRARWYWSIVALGLSGVLAYLLSPHPSLLGLVMSVSSLLLVACGLAWDPARRVAPSQALARARVTDTPRVEEVESAVRGFMEACPDVSQRLAPAVWRLEDELDRAMGIGHPASDSYARDAASREQVIWDEISEVLDAGF